MKGDKIMKTKRILFVTTKKTRCNGRINKGYSYYITVSDGENEANFINHGNDKICISDLCSAQNKYNTKFCVDKANNTLYRLYGWGSRKEVTYKQQAADMMQFVNEVLARNISIAYRDERTLTYTTA